MVAGLFTLAPVPVDSPAFLWVDVFVVVLLTITPLPLLAIVTSCVQQLVSILRIQDFIISAL